MKLSNKLSIVLFVLSVSTALAQQLPQFTQYMFNTISINPAYAGSRETFSVVGLHRSQWVGLEGGPQTQTLSIHSPLRNDKVGLGFSFINIWGTVLPPVSSNKSSRSIPFSSKFISENSNPLELKSCFAATQ